MKGKLANQNESMISLACCSHVFLGDGPHALPTALICSDASSKT